jgi:hypothetical protein
LVDGLFFWASVLFFGSNSVVAVQEKKTKRKCIETHM